MRTIPLLAALVLAALAPGVSAIAQTTTDADTLRTIPLGEVEVLGYRSPWAGTVVVRLDREDLAESGSLDLADVLSRVPGAVRQHVGPRNEAGLRLRGFDLRHVPVYVDGMPVNAPYDGLVDLRRFLVLDADQVAVTSGATTLLFGPNALAGSINIVSEAPVRRERVRARVGVGSGSGREAMLTAAARRGAFYVRGSVSGVRHDSFPLSGDFPMAVAEDGGQRENAMREDLTIDVRIGYQPNERSSFAIGHSIQNASKGNPPYAGLDESVTIRYWKWPVVDRSRYYLMGDQAIGRNLRLRARAYRDDDNTTLKVFDNAGYDTQNKPSSYSEYNTDHATGGTLHLSADLSVRHTAGIAIHAKRDEHEVSDGTTVMGRFRDELWSVGAEDRFRTGPLALTGGVMLSRLMVREARNPDSDESFARERPSALDAHLVAAYDLRPASRVYLSLARRTRFPTIKDRYSYRQGRALPNPGLDPETASTVEVGLEASSSRGPRARASLFASRIEDVIQTVQLPATGSGRPLSQMQNAGRARHVGVELSVGHNLARWFGIDADYTRLDLTNLSNPELPFTHVPAYTWSTDLRLAPREGWSILLTAVLEGSRLSRVEGSDVVRLDRHWRLDLGAQARVLPTIRVDAGLTNLLDQNYEIVAGYPEPGRVVYLRMQYELGR